MKSYIKIVSFITMAFAVVQVYGSKSHYFSHLSVEDGLSQNTVLCMLQDSQGFMWFGTKDGLNRYDGSRFRTFRQEPDNPYSLGNNFIRSLFEDSEGNIWVGTNTGLWIYDPRTEQFSRFDAEDDQRRGITGEVNDIEYGNDGNMWICANRQGLFRFDMSGGTLKLYEHNLSDPSSLSSPNVWSICFDDENKMWVGCLNGALNLYDPGNDEFIHFELEGDPDIYKITKDGHRHGQLLIGTDSRSVIAFNPYNHSTRPMISLPGYEDLFVRDIFSHNGKEIWLGTETGIYIYDYLDNDIQHLTQDFLNPYAISGNSIYSILADKDGAIWIGTYFGGIDYLPSSSVLFEKYYPTGSPDRLSGKAVREFIQDDDGYIWIGTEDMGLNRFESATGRFEHYNTRNSALSSDNIQALYDDGRMLYIGTYNGGLNIMDKRNGRISAFGKNGQQLTDNNVTAIAADHRGRVWIGETYGLDRLDPATGRLEHIHDIGEKPFIYDIAQTDDGLLYFAVYNQGVFSYSSYQDEWYPIDVPQADSLLRNVICITQDSSSNLWFGTEGLGLVKYSLAEGLLTCYNRTSGLPNDVVYKILEDRSRNLWVSTNKGLACLNQITGEIKCFSSHDGLISDQFNYCSGLKTSDGKLYFGTVNGFVGFHPERITTDVNQAPVVFTGLSFEGVQAAVGENRSPLTSSFPSLRKIKLKHDQTTFTVDFALLSYNLSRRNRYRYQMKRYTSGWVELNDRGSVTFSNMSAGKYTLEVMGANSNRVWSQQTAVLDIEVMPAWWASILAYIIYGIIGMLLVWFLVGKYSRSVRLRNQRVLDEIQHRRERAEYQAKIDFFTNITHEIRTPLSLIKGPFEQIVKPDIKPSDYNENVAIMSTNIDRLLNLMNQLLDFRKIEEASYPINPSRMNINIIINECVKQYSNRILHKNLRLTHAFPQDDIFAAVDGEAMYKVLSNLLDNAVKFGVSTISILLEALPEKFRIAISNDGEPIPQRYHQRVFEPFFQVRNTNRAGTGLGLPMVKHIVEQHKGRIYIDAQKGLTCFVVEMPYGKIEAAGEIPPETKKNIGANNSEEEIADRDSAAGNINILIAEDDEGMQAFLNNILSSKYNVYLAADVDIAIELLDRHDVDIIITDIMMPGRDGFEFCRFLKSRIEYSHIPVVILSAKTDNASKILGLDSGADVYMEKPFSADYLIAQIGTIMTNRHITRERFSQQPFMAMNTLATSNSDRAFLDRLNSIIDGNLSDENFNVDDLAAMMNMSRSTLHRKIKGIIQMTPNDFIRLIKLRKAAEMLLQGDYLVSEICYMTGFGSPSYFTKCFQKQFGVLPKDYAKRDK